MVIELFWRFLVVGLLAFGGGQAALPLVERMAVSETGWVTAQGFSIALGLSYVTPGPVLILATFIGYQVGGIGGAAAATLGVFLMPWLLAAGAAEVLRRYMQHPWLQGFSRGAGPAMAGLLGVTALSIGQQSFVSFGYAAVGVIALVLAAWTRIHPFLILAGGAVAAFGLGVLGI
jgi:chromate transporter